VSDPASVSGALAAKPLRRSSSSLGGSGLPSWRKPGVAHEAGACGVSPETAALIKRSRIMINFFVISRIHATLNSSDKAGPFGTSAARKKEKRIFLFFPV
jgi:hypothetical protein